MSRSRLRSGAVLAMVAAAPLAAHYYAAHSAASGEAEVASAIHAQQNGKPAQAFVPAKPSAAAEDASPSPKDVDDAAALAQAAGQDALAASVCQFLQEYAGFQPRSLGDAVGSQGKLPCEPTGSTAKAHVLLAIFPDPVRTHLEMRFDRAIDDLQDAVQERGWQFDSQWLPWENVKHSQPDRFGERLLDQSARKARDSTAGALFFRPSGEGAASADGPLIVLVTGDTPTGGVAPKQFHSAVQMWNSLSGSLAEPAQINILGPSFSGSIQSLVHLLPQELGAGGSSAGPCGGRAIRVASGSISSSEQLKQLTSKAPGVCPAQDVVSFAIDGNYEATTLRTYLRHKSPYARVAQLVEAESAFGSSLSKPFRSSPPRPSRPNQKVQPPNGAPYLVLHFPREISRLREAYEQNSIIGFATSADSPRSQLRFATGEQHQGTDTVPSFSGAEQTLSMESDMAEIADTLNRERVSTVLLSATDIYDEIFVARYLQQHSPRITVIIQDSDLLFLRRGEDAGLENTYVASPWSLIPQNQYWTADKGAERAHPEIKVHQNQSDEGLYAAALHLLPCPQGLTCESAAPQYRSPLAGPDAFRTHPPLWLSMVGRGQFAPVALVDSDLDTELIAHGQNPLTPPATNLPSLGSPAGEPAGISAELPFQLKLLVGIIAGLLLCHALACGFSRLDRRFAWSYALADAAQRNHRLFVQVVLSFCAVPALWILCVPKAQGFALHSSSFTAVIIFFQLLAVSTAAWSVLRWWAGGHPKASTSARRATFLAALFALGVLALVADLCLWPLIEPSATSERALFLYRSVLATPGISPSLTLLLLGSGLALWLHSYFDRWAFFGHRIPALPPSHARDLNCPSSESVASVTNLFTNIEPSSYFIKTRSTNRWIAFASVLLVAVVLCMSASWGPTSLENDRFDVWARLLSAGLAAAILNDIAIALRGWNLLQQYCLLPLKRSPLRWGFSWIQGFSWRRLWTSSYVLSPELVFDYLSRLLQANSRTWDASESVATAHKKLMDEYAAPGPRDEDWSKQVACSLTDLHKLLATRADQLLDRLKDLWAGDHGPLTGNDIERGFALQKKAEDKHSLDRMAAEEFVALLYIGYIRMVLIQIRNRIMTALLCYLFLLWALMSYSWTNHHAIIIALSALLAALSAAVLYIYSGMHRDDILSRTTATEPGKLDSGFFEKVIPTLGIPLLSLIATQFPEFNDLIFSWIEPGLRGH